MSLKGATVDSLRILATRSGLVGRLLALGEDLLGVWIVCFDHGYTIAQKEGKINPSCASSSTVPTFPEQLSHPLVTSQRTGTGKLRAESHGTRPSLAGIGILCVRVVVGTIG